MEVRGTLELTVKNIAKIKEAMLKIDGITVVSGYNDTGKSTIGKALYSVLYSMYHLKNATYNLAIISVAANLNKLTFSSAYDGNADGNYIPHFISTNLYDIAIEIYEESIKIKDELSLSTMGNIMNTQNLLGDYYVSIDLQDNIEIINTIIQIILEYPIPQTRVITQENLNDCYNGTTQNIFHKKNNHGSISLEIKNRRSSIELISGQVEKIDDLYSIDLQPIYIDTPYIMDFPIRSRQKNSISHLHNVLLNQINEGLLHDNNNRTTSEINSNVFKILDVVLPGTISMKGTSFYYEKLTDKTLASLKLDRLATGLKTFAIIKRLLSNGVLQKNSTIILDEPEVHLHPDWQLVFAELLVIMQKELSLHILINTHSNFFLEAIDVYSQKHNTSHKCNYYLTEERTDGVVLLDKTDDKQTLFRRYTEVYNKLDEEKYKND